MPEQDENVESEEQEEEESEQVTEEQKLIRTLRRQIKAQGKAIKELSSLKDDNAFLTAGLGTLSDDHKAALRAVVGEDLTGDNLLAKAKVLGFVKESDGQDEKIEQEKNAIQQTEEAVSTRTAAPDNRDFVTKIREAKSQNEIMAIISEQGEERGLLVEDEF